MPVPGESLLLPRGVPHRWWNEGDEPLAFEGFTHPAVDLDRYLQAVFDIVNAGPPGRPSLFYLAHLALRHQRTQAVLVMPLPRCNGSCSASSSCSAPSPAATAERTGRGVPPDAPAHKSRRRRAVEGRTDRTGPTMADRPRSSVGFAMRG